MIPYNAPSPSVSSFFHRNEDISASQSPNAEYTNFNVAFGGRDELIAQLSQLLSQTTPQDDLFIQIVNCRSKSDVQTVEECLDRLCIGGIRTLDAAKGTYGLVVQGAAPINLRFLSDEQETWGSSVVVLPGWPQYREDTSCRRMRPSDSFGQRFQPFLGRAQKMQWFPNLISQQGFGGVDVGLKAIIRSFLRGSFYLIDSGIAVKVQGSGRDKTLESSDWNMSVDSLYQMLLHELQSQTGNCSPEILKAMFAVLVFKLWVTLRQRNDILRLLGCPPTEEAFSALLTEFAHRYVPQELLLDDTAELTTIDLSEFQSIMSGKVHLVTEDRNSLVQCLSKTTAAVRDHGYKFRHVLSAPALRVMGSLIDHQTGEDLLEHHCQDIFESVASLTKDEVDGVFDFMGPLVCITSAM